VVRRVLTCGCCVLCCSCLQVLARSSPEDKLTLVSMLKKEGEVVAVTGVHCSQDCPARL
jgi:high-affinity K+ transport system ATPase subunit B